MRVIKVGILSLMLAGVVGCSHQSKYANAGPVEPVNVPQGASSPTQHGYYLAPSVKREKSNKMPSLTPPGSKITKAKRQVNQTRRAAG